MRLIPVVLVLLTVSTSRSANILVFQPAQARSHMIVARPLIEELAARGHNITFVTSYPHKPPLPNLTELDMSRKLPPSSNIFSFKQVKELMPNPFLSPFFFSDFEQFICEQVFSDPDVLALLNYNGSFDLVITESFTFECFVPFAHRFQAPLVTFVTSSALPWVADRMGLPDNPAYIPNYFVDLPPEMSLLGKVYNTVTLMYSKLVHNYYTLPRAQSFVKKYFGDSVPPMDQLLKNTSMMFLNSYFSFAVSRPFPPNVVEIGGIHIQNSSSPMNKDIHDILHASPEGVILVSFGSLLRTASIPQHLVTMFLNAFSTIPQTVIFKYEETLPNVPRNVIIRKWLPQQRIIEHNNVRLLIIHGGLSSTIEAVHFGKPIIGVPFFADQFLNVKSMVRRGAGLMLDMQDLTQQKIEEAINEVLTNTSYTLNAKLLSQQFRDRPMTPLQNAVYWTEHVIRHQGAPHLQPASVHLPLYKYLLLDVLAALFLPLLALFHISYYIFCTCMSYRRLKLVKID